MVMERDIAFEKAISSVNPALCEYIEKEVFPCYQGVDPAHDESHVRTVLKNALILALDYDVDMEMVYVIASYHDIGIRYGRDDHEITSARWLRGDNALKRFFDEEQIETMAKAIEDHRASSSHSPRSIYGCIIAEADRDLEPHRILRRSLQFAKAHNEGVTDEEVVRISLNHIKEKYGLDGYLKLYLHDPRNEKGLDTLRTWLATGEMESILWEELKKIS